MLQTIVNLIAGLAAGNIAGSAAKKNNPGTIISSICGLVGGGIGGALITSRAGSMEPGGPVSAIAGSAIFGALLTVFVGYIKSKISAKK